MLLFILYEYQKETQKTARLHAGAGGNNIKRGLRVSIIGVGLRRVGRARRRRGDAGAVCGV